MARPSEKRTTRGFDVKAPSAGRAVWACARRVVVTVPGALMCHFDVRLQGMEVETIRSLQRTRAVPMAIAEDHAAALGPIEMLMWDLWCSSMRTTRSLSWCGCGRTTNRWSSTCAVDSTSGRLDRSTGGDPDESGSPLDPRREVVTAAPRHERLLVARGRFRRPRLSRRGGRHTSHRHRPRSRTSGRSMVATGRCGGSRRASARYDAMIADVVIAN